jgi:ribosomal protein S18 acetylase RimI-like enzyme
MRGTQKRTVTYDIVIRELQKTDKIPYDLLLIADPSKKNIDKYILNSIIYEAVINEETIGCYVLCTLDEETIEIKNIVIDEKHQGKGLGTILLNDAINKSRFMGFKKIIIGTGNSSAAQLHLYQKVGFRITGIKSNFFSENYEEPIFENGIECRDLIVLTREL